jgi:hypothetical protein
VASGTEVGSNDSVNLNELLGVSSGLKPSHSPLPLSGRLMRVLRPVVQVAMLSMSNARHHHSFRCPVTPQFVSNNDARFASSCP